LRTRCSISSAAPARTGSAGAPGERGRPDAVRYHPHGTTEEQFVELFTADKPVVFAFHGYQRAIHEIVHGHPDVDRNHVRGFNEQGTTTTPFQMVVMTR
jgi:phosphoketolase